MTKYVIYSDGSCQPNPGKCGSGVVIYKNNKILFKLYGAYVKHGTNNIAELYALKYAVECGVRIVTKRNADVVIYSDSEYCVNTITKRYEKWLKINKKNIKNQELIKQIFDVYVVYRSRINIKWVKAHDDIEGNVIADELAKFAVEKKQVEFVKFIK